MSSRQAPSLREDSDLSTLNNEVAHLLLTTSELPACRENFDLTADADCCKLADPRSSAIPLLYRSGGHLAARRNQHCHQSESCGLHEPATRCRHPHADRACMAGVGAGTLLGAHPLGQQSRSACSRIGRRFLMGALRSATRSAPLMGRVLLAQLASATRTLVTRCCATAATRSLGLRPDGLTPSVPDSRPAASASSCSQGE